MARKEGDGLNKPARQPKNDPAVPKSRSSLVWPEGRARPLPTEERDLARRLASNPLAFEDMMEWVGKRIDLDTPTTPPVVPTDGPGGVGIPAAYVGYTRFENVVLETTGAAQIDNGSCVALDGTVHGAHTHTGSVMPIGRLMVNVMAGWGLLLRWSAAGAAISGIGFYYREVGTGPWTGFGGIGMVEQTGWVGPAFSGFNWDGTTWETPEGGLFYWNDAPSYPFSDWTKEYEVCMYACNSSGFSDGTLSGITWSVEWVHNSLAPSGAYELPPGTVSVAGGLPIWDGEDWIYLSPTGDLTQNARVGVRIDSTGTPIERRTINTIAGTGVDVSVADDSGNEEVDLTISVDPTEISITAFAFPGGTTFLRADGTFVTVATEDRMNAAFSGEPIAGGTYPVVVPRGNGDADITIDLERFALRLETPASSGDTVAILQKATGGGAPTWTDVATCTITAGNYEATEQTIGAYTITSGDLLRLYFTSVGTGADYYTGTVTGTEV